MNITALFRHPALLLLLLCSAFSYAQEMKESPSTSGNAFVRLCSVIDKDQMTERENTDFYRCLWYVRGVVDGVDEEVTFSGAIVDKNPVRPFCIPDDAEYGQDVRIVLKFVKDHPEEADLPTAFQIVAALHAAFPCPRNLRRRRSDGAGHRT